MADIVDDFLTRLQHHVPDLQPTIRMQIESGLRQDWGGNKPYVAKQPSRMTRASLVASGLRQAKSLQDCFAYAGVSRATGYRILSGK